MDRVSILLLTAFLVTAAQAGGSASVVGEVESVITRHENLTPQRQSLPLKVDYVLVQFVNGNTYQLPPTLKGVSSSTVVELDISSNKTVSGYPLVTSGRTLSLVTTVNGNRTILPLEQPMEFHE